MENSQTTQFKEVTKNRIPIEREVSDLLSEGGGVVAPRVLNDTSPGAEVEEPPGAFTRWLEDFSSKWGKERLKRLVDQKGRVSESMGSVPRNMHRVANQTRLILELIDDFRDGTYRQISWRSMALLVGAMLYAVSPAEVIPDVIPFVGQMDDLAVVGLVTRFLNRDLRRYCEFKGYDVDEYFRN